MIYWSNSWSIILSQQTQSPTLLHVNFRICWWSPKDVNLRVLTFYVITVRYIRKKAFFRSIHTLLMYRIQYSSRVKQCTLFLYRKHIPTARKTNGKGKYKNFLTHHCILYIFFSSAIARMSTLRAHFFGKIQKWIIAWDHTDYFCQRNKESEKGLIADSFLRNKRKIYDFNSKTTCHMYFFWILSQRNAKATNPENPDSD